MPYSLTIRSRFLVTLIALLVVAAPLSAVTISTLYPNSTATDFGFYSGGTMLNITTSGEVSLNGDGNIVTNPDGSLVEVAPTECGPCWHPGYQYFIPGAASYPTVYGGDGTNHFSGGGGNWDMYPSSHLGLTHWAAQGEITTDTTDPDAMRFGAVAGTWSANPVANSLDWFLVGYGGTFTVPGGGAHLYLVVVDTYYPNNTGSYTVTIASPGPVPEPSTICLASAMVLAGGVALLHRRHWRLARQT